MTSMCADAERLDPRPRRGLRGPGDAARGRHRPRLADPAAGHGLATPRRLRTRRRELRAHRWRDRLSPESAANLAVVALFLRRALGRADATRGSSSAPTRDADAARAIPWRSIRMVLDRRDGPTVMATWLHRMVVPDAGRWRISWNSPTPSKGSCPGATVALGHPVFADHLRAAVGVASGTIGADPLAIHRIVMPDSCPRARLPVNPEPAGWRWPDGGCPIARPARHARCLGRDARTGPGRGEDAGGSPGACTAPSRRSTPSPTATGAWDACC